MMIMVGLMCKFVQKILEEEKEKMMFESNISKGDTVIGIGTHIGLHTLAVAKIVEDGVG